MKFTSAKLRQALQPVLGAQRFVVAYSGGLDSHVLLAAAAELRDQLGDTRLSALHIHHGVNPAADDWVEHCSQVCRDLGIALEVKKVSAEAGQASLENALREARYQAFAQSIKVGDQLLLAHHADDQVETILLRLLRGSGALGGAGIPRARAVGQAQLYRPLLDFSRAQLAAYATDNGLNWIEDDSNRDTQYDRNFLRHQVLPLLSQRWPGYRATITRHGELNRELQQAMDFFSAQELKQLQATPAQISIERLQRYPQPVQLNLLRYWLASLALPSPGQQQLRQILTEVVAARDDAQPLLSWPGAWVRRYQNRLYAGVPLPEHDPATEYPWDTAQPLQIPGVGALELNQQTGAESNKEQDKGVRAHFDKLTPHLTVRFRQGGERCQPAGRQGSHPLKKLLQEYGVPPWLRDRVPLIYQGGELVAVGDLWVCEGYAPKHESEGCLITLTWCSGEA